MAQPIMGQKELTVQVRDAGLCTGCGACVNLCPYQVFYHDRTIVLNPCDIKAGRCHAFCPRTPVDLEALRERFFEASEFTPEIGPVKAFYITRATDARLLRKAQHGGTVSALMSLALQEGLIDAAVVAEGRERFMHEGATVHQSEELRKRTKSKFIVSPTIAEFNRTARSQSQRIGVVATPCQAFALAKMRLKPELTSGDNPIDKLKLLIGLFCGFTLSWAKLIDLLQTRTGLNEITGMEIPPGEGVLEVFTTAGTLRFPMEEVEPLMREACRYCIDTTAEYADLSVGSARFSENWKEARSWNQVVVRTRTGEELLRLAKEKGVLEFHDIPPGSLETLKKAAMKKKKTAVNRLKEKSGSDDDLLYLNGQDRVIAALR
ncbi:MAG: Coenzyme F420 hydrogenase/dehydrogenase, beta subunit C-terminal domain [Pseudomonadota bacterium]